MKNNRSHRPAARSGGLAATFLCALLSLNFFTPTAIAADAPGGIRMISVSVARPDGTRLTYTSILDAPVTQSESGEIRQQMFQQLTQQRSPAAKNSFWSFRIACGQEGERNDPSQGKFNLKLQCFPEYAVLNWGFKLAPALQVTVRGAVVEDGMTYFRNGELGGKNSPHRYGSLDHFHGTMKPFFSRDHIDFQDMFKWRNNRASTTVLVIAGSTHLG